MGFGPGRSSARWAWGGAENPRHALVSAMGMEFAFPTVSSASQSDRDKRKGRAVMEIPMQCRRFLGRLATVLGGLAVLPAIAVPRRPARDDDTTGAAGWIRWLSRLPRQQPPSIRRPGLLRRSTMAVMAPVPTMPRPRGSTRRNLGSSSPPPARLLRPGRLLSSPHASGFARPGRPGPPGTLTGRDPPNRGLRKS